MDNIIVQVSDNSQWQSMTATAAPSNVVLQGGSSDIYVVGSLDALHDSPGTTITLADADKETLDKLSADGTQTAVIVDRGGNLSVRYQLISLSPPMLLIVFLVSNGQGQTYIVGYQYRDNVCKCIIKYKLADIGENETMLTADNWPNYITLPSGGSEWTRTEDMSDINLYNAKELYIVFSSNIYLGYYTLHIVCPDGLGAHTNHYYNVATYWGNKANHSYIYYDGQLLASYGSCSAAEVWYKL